MPGIFSIRVNQKLSINEKARARLKKLGRSILAFSAISTLSSFVVLFISKSQSCRNIGSLQYIPVSHTVIYRKVSDSSDRYWTEEISMISYHTLVQF